jgi:hypothetical protein
MEREIGFRSGGHQTTMEATMSFLRKRTWFVEPRGRRWSVRRADAIYADSVHDDKGDAIARGIDLGRRAGGRCRVKARDGRIEDEHVFCDDVG